MEGKSLDGGLVEAVEKCLNKFGEQCDIIIVRLIK